MSQHGVNDKGTYTWLQTSSNHEVDFAADEWPVLPIEDIANALANTCRFNGHSNTFYSVAEHSVKMSEIVPHELALAALLHDGTEAYVGDVPTPLKRFLGLNIKDLEHKAALAISRGYNVALKDLEHPTIKEFDKKILGDEARALMPPHQFWEQFPDRLGVLVEGWPPDVARQKFLDRFNQLKK
jgi:hypothetical protein